MNIKDFIDKYRLDSELFGIKNCFEQLEKLNNEFKKIRKKIKNINDIEIIDPYTNEIFYVNSLEAQDTFDFFYQKYYYEFFLKKYECCRVMVIKIEQIILSEKPDYELSKDLSLLYFQTILTSLKHFVKMFNLSINYDLFYKKLRDNLKIMFGFDDSNDISEFMLQSLIIDGFFYKKNNELFFADDAVRLDLVVISYNCVKISIPDNEFTAKFSCYYGLATIYFILFKYLSTRNTRYQEYLLLKYSNDIEKYFLLRNNLDDYKILNFSIFSSFKNDDLDYLLLIRIYVDKITLNEYCFHTIINCLFKNYYFSSRANILHGLNLELAQRLIP